jgi:hypothetical protein
MCLIAKPVKRSECQAFVAEHHRHHKKGSVGDIFRIGIALDSDPDTLIGVAQIGRPVAKALDDGWSLEVTRVCINGTHKNACSFIYARAARMGQAAGYRRIYTYTLEQEGGASLRGAGWTIDKEDAGGGSWNRKKRPRQDGLFPQMKKIRWVKVLN